MMSCPKCAGQRPSRCDNCNVPFTEFLFDGEKSSEPDRNLRAPSLWIVVIPDGFGGIAPLPVDLVPHVPTYHTNEGEALRWAASLVAAKAMYPHPSCREAEVLEYRAFAKVPK